MKKKKYILVLSGGGAKGAFQIGALKYIFEKGIPHADSHTEGKDVLFDYVAGISAGSLNAAMVAAGKFPELEDLWTNTIAGNPGAVWVSDFVNKDFQPSLKNIFLKLIPKLNWRNKLGLLFKKNQEKFGKQIIEKILNMEAVASSKPLEEKINQLMNVAEVKSEILRVGFVSLENGKYYSIKHSSLSDKEFKKAILASAAMPAIFPMVKSIAPIDGQPINKLVDGGIRNVSPLGDIVKDVNENYDKNTDYYIIIINNHCGKLEPLKEASDKQLNFLNIAYRSMLDITLNEIFENDISEFIRINDLLRQVDAFGMDENNEPYCLTNLKDGRTLRKFYYKIIQPEDTIGNTLDFSKDQVLSRIEKGYQAAQKVFEETVEPCNHNNFWDINTLKPYRNKKTKVV